MSTIDSNCLEILFHTAEFITFVLICCQMFFMDECRILVYQIFRAWVKALRMSGPIYFSRNWYR